MKKVFALFLTVLTLLAVMTGCIHEDIGVILNADGTGKIAATVGVEEGTYNQLLGMGVDLFSDSESEPVEYEYKGKHYISVSETTEYATYEELRQALLDMTYDTDELAELKDAEDWETDEKEQELDEILTTKEPDDAEEDAEETAGMDNHIFKEVVIEEKKGLFSKGLTFSATMNALPDDENEENSMASSFHVTVSVETPYGIKKTGEGAVVEGNKATFEIEDLSVENTFSVEAEETNTELIISLVVLLVIVLAAIILLPKLTGSKENKDKK